MNIDKDILIDLIKKMTDNKEIEDIHFNTYFNRFIHITLNPHLMNDIQQSRDASFSIEIDDYMVYQRDIKLKQLGI